MYFLGSCFSRFPRGNQIQASNLRELEASLADLQKQYCREVDKRVRAEEAKADEEERLFAALVSMSPFLLVE